MEEVCSNQSHSDDESSFLKDSQLESDSIDIVEEVLDNHPAIPDDEMDIEDELEKDYREILEKDVISKFQFDYNRSTCLANDVPEIEGADINEIISIAPGEGKTPKSILTDPDWDMKSHPNLDPTGENSLNAERPVKISAQKYFEQRIFNADMRYAKSMSYVFAATSYCESKQLNEKINISFSRGHQQRNSDGGLTYTLNDPCAVFDNVKNTPRFWKKKRDELLAKLENLGPFQFFFTLSCADQRYEENYTSLLNSEYKIVYKFEKGRERAFIEIDGVEESLNDFLSRNVSKHEFIRKNVLTATRNFYNRVKNFIKHIVMNKENPMCVENYNYRVEFQSRGAAHIHGVLWLDLDAFSARQNDLGKSSFLLIKEAFKSVNNDEIPSSDHCKVLEDFAEMFISSTVKSPGGRIASEVNRHHHTKTCRKKGTNCRFHFPRFPSTKTILSIPARILYPDEQEREKNQMKIDKVLEKVKDVLENEESMQEICDIHKADIDLFLEELDEIEGEENEIKFLNSKNKEISTWREKRILALLKKANVAEDMNIDLSLPEPTIEAQLLKEYTAILRVSKRDYSIINIRDVDEIYINNFNEEFIRAWDGNMDIQLTATYYAIVTYISDYHMKDDTGTMEYIKAAVKQSENEPLRERLKLVKNEFLTHRQMGESEAYYRLIPSLRLTDSNITTYFLHTGFKKSRLLKAITPEQAKTFEKSRLIQLENNTEDFFIESPSLRDKYLRRPRVLEHITLAQFVKRYNPVPVKSNGKKNKEANIIDYSLNCPNDYGIRDNYIISPISVERVSLPTLVELEGNPIPGESNFLQLRKPLALRYHKFKETNNPHEYYFSEMELYTHFRKESELFPEDIVKCEERYNRQKNSIQYIKSRVMEFLQVVEEARENAEEILNEEVAIELDSEANQDNAECNLLGTGDVDSFIALDSEGIQRTTDDLNLATEGVYKRIEIQNEDIL